MLSLKCFILCFFGRGGGDGHSGRRAEGGSEFTLQNGIRCVMEADALIEVVLLAVFKQGGSICTGEKTGWGADRADWWSTGSQRAG